MVPQMSRLEAPERERWQMEQEAMQTRQFQGHLTQDAPGLLCLVEGKRTWEGKGSEDRRATLAIEEPENQTSLTHLCLRVGVGHKWYKSSLGQVQGNPQKTRPRLVLQFLLYNSQNRQ